MFSNFYRYLDLLEENAELKSNNECLRSALEGENRIKKPRVESNEIPKDPLKLPEPCVNEILQYFKGKDLLQLTEVSIYWKNYIESKSIFVNRAMDRIIARFDDYSIINDVWHFKPSLNRKYKHMKAFFPQYIKVDNSHRLLPLIGQHASSIKTLDIECVCFCAKRFENDLKLLESSDFVCLNNLSIDCKSERLLVLPTQNVHEAFANFIKSSSFPEVIKLYLPSFIIENSIVANFNAIVHKFPKLKKLFTTALEMEYIDLEENWPKIEVLGVSEYEDRFVNAFKDTLTEIYFDCSLVKRNISDILVTHKKLKNLMFISIMSEDDEEEVQDVEYPQHTNMEDFKVKYLDNGELQDLLLAFTSLKHLTVAKYEISADIVNFLGKGLNVKLHSLNNFS